VIFNRLQIQNFGLFCGTHDFDLKPREKAGRLRPIVLFGGKNGAGKTTILEAVRLCVFGKSAVGDRIGEREYLEHLVSRIHRPRGGDVAMLTQAHIELEFTHTHFGDERTYTARRAWGKKGNGFEEELTLGHDGETDRDESEIEDSLAQDFLKELIPFGVSELFFFDGEKIQELASDDDRGSALGESVKAMLNLDVVERLQADLRIHLNRRKREAQAGDIKVGLEAQEENLREIDRQRESLLQALANLETRHVQKSNEVEHEEESFRQEGGAYATEFSALKEKASGLEVELEGVESRMRELSAGLLPFALVPELCKSLGEQLEAEATARQLSAGSEVLRESAFGLRDKLGEEFGLGTDDTGRLVDLLVESILARAPKDVEPRHVDLSDRDAGQIMDWLARELAIDTEGFRELSVSAERATRQLQKVRRQINKAPDEDIAAGRVQKIKELTHMQGELSRERALLQNELKSLDQKKSEVQRSYQKTLSLLTDSEDAAGRTDLTEKVQRVLDRFLRELSKDKVEQLEEAVAISFASLHRKGDMIRSMKVDPTTFRVTLLGRGNRPIAKAELSAGEKQIYAIAVLWALAGISGRPLPVVIDTPLGRLDSDHRKHLVESYFPHASHQVIILSTDTEVDGRYFKELSKHVSHAYHLEYHPTTMETIASEGYFWKSHKDESEDGLEQGHSLLRGVGAA
jgi:DNA sulfur modification protein DndD